MNKIKTIKLKDESGNVSENAYYLTVDANNVDMANGKNIQEIIGDINIEVDGSIISQLIELRRRVIELEEKIKD